MPKIHAYLEQKSAWNHYPLTSDLSVKVEGGKFVVTILTTQHNLHWVNELVGATADQVIPDTDGKVNGDGRSFPNYPLETPLPLVFIQVNSR
ncbi:MAG: hypothetical protein HZA34_03360 [Candidatus Pacebacteria bacterium]|nr:hypothetical protein [Candidatus Paceibacterota bacterium]